MADANFSKTHEKYDDIITKNKFLMKSYNGGEGLLKDTN